MKINKETFCVAPWFEIRSSPMGEFNVCCQIVPEKSNFKEQKYFKWPKHTPKEFFNSDYVKYLRKNLSSGKKLPECNACWRSEKLNNDGSSLRKSLNNTYINSSIPDWSTLYFKNKKDFYSTLVLYADITLSNVCNFSCITCNPAESSKIYTKWKKNKDQHIIKKLIDGKEKNYFQEIDTLNKSREKNELLQHILNFKPKTLKILGGEPLIDKKNLNYLASLNENEKKNISLNFVTNGSKNLLQNNNALGNFKDIFYVISLEGTEKVQEYIREGSKWEEIKTNIEEYRKINPFNHLSVSCVLQALNAYHIGYLEKWCKKLNIELHYIILDDPSFMGVSSIPPKLREKIINYYSKNNNINLDFNELFSQIPYSPKNQKDLKEFLDWNDQTSQWRDIFPEWNNIM